MTKVISLSEDAYRRLKIRKVAGESFSDVIVRLTSERKLVSVLSLGGTWEGSDAKEVMMELKRDRKAANSREAVL